MKSLTFSTLLILLLLILGVTFRLYNINFDNLWIDEIASFWISNPDFDFNESHFRFYCPLLTSRSVHVLQVLIECIHCMQTNHFFLAIFEKQKWNDFLLLY